MTEDEKRQLALSLFQQEQARFQNRSASLFDNDSPILKARLQRSEQRHRALSVMEQNGISWQDLKRVYDENYEAGKRDMVDFKMTFFYCSAAIALHDLYKASSEDIIGFLERVARIMGEEHSLKALIQKVIDITEVDVSYADSRPTPVRTTKKDKSAINRIRKTGITQRDLEDEKQIGYEHGWNTEFYLSACYASAALALHEMCNGTSEQIEDYLDRIEEISYSEITRKDILERCNRETGLEVEGLITGWM